MIAFDDSPLAGAAAQRGSSKVADSIRRRVVQLYETHRDGIYRFLVAQGLTPAEAQDVAQDVFVDLFVALEKGTELKSEQGWLYAVAGRAAVDHWRRERPAFRVELDLERKASVDFPSAEPSPEAEAGRQERLRHLAAGLVRLPREQRLCVQLRMQGLRYREIAEILGVSTSTAAEWLVAAVESLRGESR